MLRGHVKVLYSIYKAPCNYSELTNRGLFPPFNNESEYRANVECLCNSQLIEVTTEYYMRVTTLGMYYLSFIGLI